MFDHTAGTIQVLFRKMDAKSQGRIRKILEVVVVNQVIDAPATDQGRIRHHSSIADEPTVTDNRVPAPVMDTDTVLIILRKRAVLHAEIIGIGNMDDGRTDMRERAVRNTDGIRLHVFKPYQTVSSRVS